MEFAMKFNWPHILFSTGRTSMRTIITFITFIVSSCLRGRCRNIHVGVPWYRPPKVTSTHFRPLVTDFATTLPESTFEVFHISRLNKAAKQGWIEDMYENAECITNSGNMPQVVSSYGDNSFYVTGKTALLWNIFSCQLNHNFYKQMEDLLCFHS